MRPDLDHQDGGLPGGLAPSPMIIVQSGVSVHPGAMTDTTNSPETFTEDIILTMTPSLRQCLKAFASERGWYETAAVRYFIEDGLAGEARRAELANEAADCPPRRSRKKLRWVD
jgi:hypothetical protein